MKSLYTLIVLLAVSAATLAQKNKVYTTSGGNGGILSFSTIERNGKNITSIPRFSPVFNFGTNIHYDAGNTVGFFTGINVKNIGLIMKDSANLKFKRRVYTIGIPVAFKIGNMKQGNFFYAGAEAELAFNYKEKRFEGGKKKSKFNEWFSDRTPLFMPAVFAGFHTRSGVGLKAHYYLNNFFNEDFSETINGAEVRPYKGLKANVFFITLGYDFDLKEVFKRKRGS
jgi:hypothetical protein